MEADDPNQHSPHIAAASDLQSRQDVKQSIVSALEYSVRRGHALLLKLPGFARAG